MIVNILYLILSIRLELVHYFSIIIGRERCSTLNTKNINNLFCTSSSGVLRAQSPPSWSSPSIRSKCKCKLSPSSRARISKEGQHSYSMCSNMCTKRRVCRYCIGDLAVRYGDRFITLLLGWGPTHGQWRTSKGRGIRSVYWKK